MAPPDDDSDWVPYFTQFSTNDPDGYFARLIGLLENGANGEPAGVTTAFVTHADEADPITAAVDFRLHNGTPELFQTLDGTQLQQLCLQVYATDQVPSLGSDPLAPEWIDLLAVIAYVRQHITTLTHLVSNHPPPSHPSFSRFGQYDRRNRLHSLISFAESPSPLQTRLLLLRLWTPILAHSTQSPAAPRGASCWAHLHSAPEDLVPAAWERRVPDYWGLRLALFKLLRGWTPSESASPSPETFTSTIFPFLKALRDACHLYPDGSSLAELLTTVSGRTYKFEDKVPALVPLEVARELMTGYIPPDGYKGEDAISILLPLAAVPTDNADRMEVVRLAVQAGCHVDARMEDSQTHGYSEWMRYSRWQRGTALHVAAERGDMEMVECLLGLGARVDVWWHGGVEAAEVARRAGHEIVAARIEEHEEQQHE
ncbi:hypothetical protein QBC34DRAFT_444572 [Podospora aff. communis PSN243]|uniref:Ankyrin repeat protein n=1 Tax=Podospora aff. communis PSN243 TaxID=3040156 RepID=A0AAV9FWA2_9PEZI|nr:hypothetical protein QBC34DRAFT_444572 [Podospora aff. communis PSN243]